jgi:flagella basal body P-ring formation protein FlgA
MTCCAELRALAVLFAVMTLSAPLPVLAQANAGVRIDTVQPAAEGSARPAQSSFERRVAAAVAQRWGVDASRVRIEPSSSATEWPADDATFELGGSGADGMWLLDIRAASQTSRLIVRAGTEMLAPTAAHDLERNITIAVDDIMLAPTVEWGPPRDRGVTVEAGWITRRRITRGDALKSPAVAPPIAVRPGDAVQLVFETDGISITLQGRAAGQASVGQRVAVRADTGKRLEGIVTEPGVVRVGGPRREH